MSGVPGSLPRQAVVLLLALSLSPLRAADLMDLYRLAREQDPVFAAARHALEGVRQRVPQARAGLLPSVALTGGDSRNRSNVDFGRNSPAQDRNIRSWNWNLQLTQPILRLQNHYAFDEAESLVEQARAQFEEADQGLLLRVTQAYFDVAAAEEAIAVAAAQARAMNEQLALAQRGFENGTGTLTDVHEARARVELARAEEVAARNEREEKRSELEKIVGEAPEAWGALAVLSPAAVAPRPQPDDVREWIANARQNHPSVRAREAALAAAEAAVRKHRAEHLPTLDLVASHGRSHSSGSLDTPNDYSTAARANVVGLQLTIPLYAGGGTNAKVAEAIAARDQARADLEAARRQAAGDARQAFSGIATGASRIEALDAAVASGQSAVQGNRIGFRLGIRINVDVLNAEQQLYASQRDRTQARYETLMQGLKLKAAAGILDGDDLETINRMLGPGEGQGSE